MVKDTSKASGQHEVEDQQTPIVEIDASTDAKQEIKAKYTFQQRDHVDFMPDIDIVFPGILFGNDIEFRGTNKGAFDAQPAF